jgi:hypothetical protein
MPAELAINFTNGAPAPQFTATPGPQFVNTTTGEVTEQPPEPEPMRPVSHLPARFEGSPIGMTEIKISGACSIEAGDITVSLDDMVRAVGVYRVTKVLHYVHPKTGETVRQQVLSPVETLVVVPWDSSNPDDDGIVRARP